MQGPLGDIGRYRDFLWDYLSGTGWQRYFKELFGDIDDFFCCRKQMRITLAKGAIQGPLGDIGRHGD